MVHTFYMKKVILIIPLIAFLVNTLGPLPVSKADEFHLPQPGVMVNLSPPLNPVILKGIKVNPDNPFQFDFIMDSGDDQVGPDTNAEAARLVKYFLASLTIPEKDLWVNLSPYEKNRIIPDSFGKTEMGRDLLAEDYILKQITASLVYPEGETGRKFWQRIYQEAQKKYGTTDIPVGTFNKVWIIPQKAVVYENAKEDTACDVDGRLNVMLEQDYLALNKAAVVTPTGGASALASQIVREIVIPELTNEVNEDKNFARLRQVYNSLILATWYKNKIKNSILEKIYADQRKVAGVGYEKSVVGADSAASETEKIYQRYVKAFKKGVFNYIKEEPDPLTQQISPRKYFSGGVDFAMKTGDTAMKGIDSAMTVTKAVAALQIFIKSLDIRRLLEVKGNFQASGPSLVFTPVEVPQGYRLAGGANDPSLAQELHKATGLTAALIGPNIYSPAQDNWLTLRFMDVIGSYIDKLNPSANSHELRVLVIGAGSGLDALTAFHHAKQKGFSVKMTAVDIKDEAVENIKKNFALSADAVTGSDSINIFKVLGDGQLSEVHGQYDLILFNAPDAVSKDQLQGASDNIRMDRDVFRDILQAVADRLLAKQGMAIVGNQRTITDPQVFVGGKLQSLIPPNLRWEFSGTSEAGVYLKQEDRVFFFLTRGKVMGSAQAEDYSMVATYDRLEKDPLFKGRVSRAPRNFTGMIELGQGGAGKVYQDPHNPKIFYKVALTKDSRDVERSAKVIAMLNRAGVTRDVPLLTEVGLTDTGFFWMELNGIERGEDLEKSQVWSNSTLSEKLDIFIETADMISQLHRLGYAHNDIKPKNIILNADREVMVIDFGESRPFGKKHQITLGYSAPENEGSAASDIYSLGMTFSDMLYDSENNALKGLLKQMTNESISLRVPTMKEVIRRLKEIRDGQEKDAAMSSSGNREDVMKYSRDDDQIKATGKDARTVAELGNRLIKYSNGPQVEAAREELGARDFFVFEEAFNTGRDVMVKRLARVLKFESRGGLDISRVTGEGFIRWMYARGAMRYVKDRSRVPQGDKAMNTENNGGIDLTPARLDMQIKTGPGPESGQGIKFHLDPALLAQLQNAPGLMPVIASIKPVSDLKIFLE